MSEKAASALLSTDRAIVFDEKDASRIWNKGHFGEYHGGNLELSMLEALFLMEQGRLALTDGAGKEISYKQLYTDCTKKYENFVSTFDAYKDLRARGYIVKTGFKFGAHFRLYPKGTNPGEGHSDFLVNVLSEEYPFSLQDLSRSVRLSHSVKKKIWYAVVDSEGDLTYYEIVRVKP
ncbi:MAG: tRNA-intron lyase [archaeon]